MLVVAPVMLVGRMVAVAAVIETEVPVHGRTMCRWQWW